MIDNARQIPLKRMKGSRRLCGKKSKPLKSGTGKNIVASLVSRFRSSPEFAAGTVSERRNHKGHYKPGLASVIQIEKFARSLAANDGEFLDHHTRPALRGCGPCSWRSSATARPASASR